MLTDIARISGMIWIAGSMKNNVSRVMTLHIIKRNSGNLREENNYLNINFQWLMETPAMAGASILPGFIFAFFLS